MPATPCATCVVSPQTTGGASGTDANGIAQGGYFVLTGEAYSANLGGLSGASAKCLNELKTHPWKGKGSAGTLTASRVKAFLCDDTSCNILQPYTKYTFAAARDISAGGAAFTTDQHGQGPTNTGYWYDATHFNKTSTYYWTGRTGWGNNPLNKACSNWSVNTGPNGAFGNTSGSSSDRWYSVSAYSCVNPYYLICMVNPATE